ncbi:D-erythronate dehydrogenase [Arenibacterium halophilum]|nr:D-erythronate dehydrogenase [Arenibacterium halophilum]
MKKRVLVLGAGGMIGQKLLARLVRDGIDGAKVQITAHDIAFPDNAVPVDRQIIGSVTEPGVMERLVADDPEYVFHLAAIVSGEAEADFDKGWQTNMFPCWSLLQALRARHEATGGSYRPRLVFTSSIAVFGAPFEDEISDTFLTAPLTSYGAQKVICEQMISDFSRKGFIDGVAIRLPSICVRPGKANRAAAGFFSGIIREPLNGVQAVLPVPDTVVHTHASPRSAVGFLCHAATLDTDRLNGRRAINMPGVACTVAEQIEALRDAAGEQAVALIRREDDPAVAHIVDNWPTRFNAARAHALGFRAETEFREIIQTYIEEDLKPAQ